MDISTLVVDVVGYLIVSVLSWILLFKLIFRPSDYPMYKGRPDEGIQVAIGREMCIAKAGVLSLFWPVTVPLIFILWLIKK